MNANDEVCILLVDDQPAKLLSYEVILADLGEEILKATSGREALKHLLKREVAVILMDVSMPELDGFQLAAMIREHPRFRQTAIIFISAIHLNEIDAVRGYEMGAVDYVPVPVVPQVLRAKVKVFVELYRKTHQLETLNAELERRVAERTAEVEAGAGRLRESERRRTFALAAGQMGSWDWDVIKGDLVWDEGQRRIFGLTAGAPVTAERVRAMIEPEDWRKVRRAIARASRRGQSDQAEFRIRRPSGETRWCLGTAASSVDEGGSIVRLSGVTVDITERKEAEVRQLLLSREVDHRARNALAVMHSIVRLTRADSMEEYLAAVEGRISALSRAHTLLSESRWVGADLVRLIDEEMAPYRADQMRVTMLGERISLDPSTAQTLALAIHELATNAAKYGALSAAGGSVTVNWRLDGGALALSWTERGGPPAGEPGRSGFGTRLIRASIEDQLGGSTDFQWCVDGLRCVLSVPFGNALRADCRPEGARARPADPLRERSEARAFAGAARSEGRLRMHST